MGKLLAKDGAVGYTLFQETIKAKHKGLTRKIMNSKKGNTDFTVLVRSRSRILVATFFRSLCHFRWDTHSCPP